MSGYTVCVVSVHVWYMCVHAYVCGVCFDVACIEIMSSTQEGGISLLKFSPGGTHLAVVSGQGHLSLWELNLTGQGISKVGGHNAQK